MDWDLQHLKPWEAYPPSCCGAEKEIPCNTRELNKRAVETCTNCAGI